MPETMTPPAAPSAAPSPSPAPAPSGGDQFESQLESALGADTTPSAPPAAEPKPTPAPTPTPAPAAAKPAEPKKPEVKPAAPAKAPEKAAEPKPAEGPKALREELERVRQENANFKRTSDELAVKIKDYEARGKDTEALKARLEQRDKEFEAMQGELRALKREASPEFKKQYDEPLNRAMEDAVEVVATMVKTDGTQANFDRDVLPIYHLAKRNYGQAYAAAREQFGDDQAPAVMQHLAELRRLDTARTRAFEAEKKGWEEREKAEQGRMVQEREQDAATWNKVVEDLKNTVEDYRDPVDDAELATARAKGIEIYDYQPQSKQEHFVKFAHIRHRLGAYEAQKLQIARANARIAELEAQIEEGKVRQPGEEPAKPAGTTAPVEEDWAGGLVKAVKGA